MGPAEAQALFRRHGYESVMPYERFAYTLLSQPSRQMAEDMPRKLRRLCWIFLESWKYAYSSPLGFVLASQMVEKYISSQ